jgi:general secretion pathway protein D
MQYAEANKPHRAGLGRIVAVILAGTVASCADQPPLPEPLNVAKRAQPKATTLMSGEEDLRRSLTASEGLAPPVGRTLAEPFSTSTPPRLTGENITVNFEGIRLPAFVNTVFGELLKVNFEIDPAVAARDQMVTLRTAEPMPPEQFYRVVTEVLGNYGLTIAYQSTTNLYRIIEASTARQDVPQIVRSRALSTVPGDQRPIFFFTPLHNIQSGFMQAWLELALRDRVRFQGIPNFNGLLLMGKREDIAAALETIDILDQPAMAGHKSMKISPAFWSAARLAEQLVSVLVAEGYSAGVGAASQVAVKFVPIQALNTIIVFSTSDVTMQHVLQWATELDRPSEVVNTQGIYYYPVQNASAKKVADIVSQIIGLSTVPVQAATSNTGQPGTPDAARPQTAGQRVIVDESRNAIIYQGTAEEYAQFRLLVEQMDMAPLEVLIEATVAEVTLDENESLGVVLGFDDGAKSLPNRSTLTSDTGIFATLLRSNGQINVNINALSSNSRVTVLSTPRLVTTSGVAASITVGTQVPVVTTQQTAPTGSVGGTSNILQDIQYRSTGITLNIKPIINSSRRVELTLAQEVSSASANNISGIDSPIIQQRSIQTTLSVTDGETALLGGLISENFNSGDSGVPFLKDIPILGNLFKNQSSNKTRTELIVLITPYIIDGPETARAVRDAFKEKLGDWAQDRPGAAAVESNVSLPATP